MLKFDWDTGTITAPDGETRTFDNTAKREDGLHDDRVVKLVSWAYGKGLVDGFEPMRAMMADERSKMLFRPMPVDVAVSILEKYKKGKDL